MITAFYHKLREAVTSSSGIFLTQGDSTVYYDEFLARIEHYIAILSQYKREKVVIIAAKSVECYAAILATLFTNNIWVPLSHEINIERLSSILSGIHAKLLLHDSNTANAIPLELLGGDHKSICMEEIAEDHPKGVLEQIEFQQKAQEVAMIYFTSGSTGIPKGVVLSQENYIVNISNMMRLIDYGDRNVFADLHDTSFVISIPVIFPCILKGGTFAIPNDSMEAGYPADLLERDQVSCLITVPSLVERLHLQRSSGEFEMNLDCLIVCGEPCHVGTMEFIFKRIKPKSVYNFYGSTEVAPWVFYFKVISLESIPDSSDFMPIGVPIDPENFEVANDGELHIGGPQVSVGYLNGDPDERFFKKDNKAWFKMGDIVEKRGDYYYCLGRKDSQVKINGYRIDLLEIEGALQSIDKVESAMCIVKDSKVGKFILGVIFSKSEHGNSCIQNELKSKLPSYMIPRKFAFHKDKPLNKNGKLDRAQIRELYR